MSVDWRVAVLAQFLSSLGISAEAQLMQGHLALSFDDGDVLHIELCGFDQIDLLLSHDLFIPDSFLIVKKALEHNYYKNWTRFHPSAYCYKDQLVLKIRLDSEDITLSALNQGVASLRNTLDKMMAIN